MSLAFSRRPFGLELTWRGRYVCAYICWATQGYHHLWYDGPHSALNVGFLSLGWGCD